MFLNIIKFVISFALYLFLYFIFMFIIVMIIGPNYLIEQAKHVNENKEILTLMFSAGCIWGFGVNHIYFLILKMITKIMEIINKKIKSKKISI